MMLLRKPAFCCGLLIIALSCLCRPALAEKADSEKPVNLDADSVSLDNTTRISKYDGAVVLTQGTLSLHADHLVVKQNNSGVESATATGHPVHFRQRMDPDKNGEVKWVEGSALRIEYNEPQNRVELFDQAWIKHGGDEVHGDHITYNTLTGDFHVQGNASRPGSKDGRVHAIIQPRPKAASDK